VNLKVDPGQQMKPTVGSLEPSHLWILGLAVDDDGSAAGPGRRQPSYLAECECPDDCVRDHENE
jgi:hypothetical protein